MPQAKRKHLRAPLKTGVLYPAQNHVFKTQAINISAGGLLLENLSPVPETKGVPLMLALTHHPDLAQLGIDTLKSLPDNDFPQSVIRVKARIVRSFEGFCEVDQAFVHQIGLEFAPPAREVADLIDNYVRSFSKNLVFFLNLFEERRAADDTLCLRKIAQILGYEPRLSMASLRLKSLHDYRSLTSG